MCVCVCLCVYVVSAINMLKRKYLCSFNAHFHEFHQLIYFFFFNNTFPRNECCLWPVRFCQLLVFDRKSV